MLVGGVVVVLDVDVDGDVVGDEEDGVCASVEDGLVGCVDMASAFLLTRKYKEAMNQFVRL